MKCPICGTKLYPGADRCHDCGCHVQTCSAPFEESRPSRKKKRLSVVLLTLLGLLPVLFIIVFSSLIVFSVHTYQEPVIPEYNIEANISLPDDFVPASLPQSDESCFSMEDGNVTFLPEHWDGTPIVRVPETVNGEPVIGLAPGCFAGCAELTTILLPDGIVNIGPEAFSGCTRMRGLFLPEGTRTVGEDAFAGCLGLEAVYVPSSVRSIAEGCFSDCAGLLYIFYEGSFDDWNVLCDDYITPFTAAICLDGTYYHGTGR